MGSKRQDFGLHKKSFPNDIDVDRIVKAMKAKSKMYFDENKFGSPEIVTEINSENFPTPDGYSGGRPKTTFKCRSPGILEVGGADDGKFGDDFDETNWGVATPLFGEGEEPAEYWDDVIYSKLAKLNQQKVDEPAENTSNKPESQSNRKLKNNAKITSTLARYSNFTKIGWACVFSISMYFLIWFMTL